LLNLESTLPPMATALHLTVSGSDAFVRLQFGIYNNGSFSSWIQSSYDNSPGGSGSSGPQGLAINPQGGNVGIGNTGPSEKLHVSGNIRVTGAYYDSSNAAGTSGQILSSTGTGTAWIAAPSGGGISGGGTANYVTKWTSGSAVGNSVMYDDGTNVAIGTTVPTTTLDVRKTIPASSGSSPIVRVGNSSGDWGNYSMIEASNVPDGRSVRFGAYLGASAYSQGGFAVVTGDSGAIATNPSIKFFVRHDGHVGIGTINPAANAKLTIDGSAGANTSQIDMVGYSSTAKGHLGQFANSIYLSTNYYYSGGQFRYQI
jgi:hypothetical protein